MKKPLPPRSSRRLRGEPLEPRQMLSGWHNAENPVDVNIDGTVSPVDALAVINALNRGGTTALPLTGPRAEGEQAIDVDNNGLATPSDALGVINSLHRANGAAPLAAPDPAKFPAAISVKDQAPGGLLAAAEVATLLDRASSVTDSQDAIIAIVDRSGRILGVRLEANVAAGIQADPAKLAFAVDGAVAKARTAAFFSSNAAPLTSRTIRFISQSTVTQREVESSPTAADPRYRGPGFVAPIGVGGNFPPEIAFTPQVDLLGIEHQSRDSQRHAGADGILGNVDDFELKQRFNAPPMAIPAVAHDFFQTWPESYGVASGTDLFAQSRGIATLPGGVPLYKQVGDGVNLVGGIGVFFPGETGFASEEQDFVHASQRGGVPQTEKARTNAEKVLESEYIALVAAAGEGILGRPAFARNISSLNAKLPPLPDFVALNGRIDLVGITLEIYGPTPSPQFPLPGIDRLLQFGRPLTAAVPQPSGMDLVVDTGGDQYLDGQAVPEGWLVAPIDSPLPDGMKAEEVERIIRKGIEQADQTRAAIRLNEDFLPGDRTRMVLAVTDTSGNLLGLHRMPDATIFSIDVAVAKARNAAYYADPVDLLAADRVDFDGDGLFEKVTQSLDEFGDTVPLGTALTARTFRFLVGPRFPTGVELSGPPVAQNNHDPLCQQDLSTCLLVGPQSGLRMPGINPATAENVIDDQPLSHTVYADPASPSTLLFDAFVPSRNFRDPGDADVRIEGTATLQPLANQNGVVFFPGSTSLYRHVAGAKPLSGGLGVSGDGVDQDDVVTAAAQQEFAPPTELRVDQYTVGRVRLPFQKFNRNPTGS